MMEEDDVSKIAKELQDAALTDVTQASVKEATPPLLISDIKKEPSPPRFFESANPVPPQFETLVSSIPSAGFDSGPAVTPGKIPMIPIQPASSLPGVPMQSSYFHSPQNTPSPDPGYFQPSSQDARSSPPAIQPQPVNPYRAVSGLGTHVPAPSVAPTNIFVPPFVQDVPQPVYQPQPPHYMPPINAFPHDNHSHQCGGHGHSHDYRGGESFLEIPQDHSVPAWDVGHYHQSSSADGLFGWFSNVGNKVFEKTKSSVESMITTLDPGMKAVLYSGGDVDIIVTSSNSDVVEGIRQAFQEVFGRATVNGMEARSDIAPQPVGFTAGLRGAENKIENLRRSAAVHECQPLVSIESFIHEVFPDKWFEFSCLVLKDPLRNVDLTTFTQATPINPIYIQQAQEFTPKDYELRWSGLSLTIGEIIGRNLPHVHPQVWQKELCGVSRRDSVYGAAKVLASLYKNQCH